MSWYDVSDDVFDHWMMWEYLWNWQTYFLCDKRNQCRSEFTESALRDAWVRLRCDTQQSGTFWLAEIVQFDHDFSNVLSDLLNVISSERHFVL